MKHLSWFFSFFLLACTPPVETPPASLKVKLWSNDCTRLPGSCSGHIVIADNDDIYLVVKNQNGDITLSGTGSLPELVNQQRLVPLLIGLEEADQLGRIKRVYTPEDGAVYQQKMQEWEERTGSPKQSVPRKSITGERMLAGFLYYCKNCHFAYNKERPAAGEPYAICT